MLLAWLLLRRPASESADLFAPNTPDRVLERLTTDESGQTRPVELPAPDPAYSMTPDQPRPYTDYNIEITAPGYEPVRIVGSELLPNEISLQNVSMTPLERAGGKEEENGSGKLPGNQSVPG